MANKSTMAGLLGILGGGSKHPASTLMRLGTAGVVHAMVREADRRLEERGGSPIGNEGKRLQRKMAATVRRRSNRGGVVRSASRAVAKSARPSAVQRRNMRRESYRRQGESLSDEQLLSISPSDLPPELVRQRKVAMANRPRDEKGRFLPAGSMPAVGDDGTPATPPAPAVDDERQKIDQQLRDILGDTSKLPPHVRAQLEEQIAEKFGQPSESPPSTSGPAPALQPEPVPQPTAAQRKQEDTKAIIYAQLNNHPQPKPEKNSGDSGGLGVMDGIQTALDVAGIFDPTPISDGTNAVISLGRAALDPKHAPEHLMNAGISATSAIIPYAGDFAKLGKIPGLAVRTARTVKTATRAEKAAKGAGATAKAGSKTAQRAVTEGVNPAGQRQLRRTVRRVGHGIANMFGMGDDSQPPGDDEQREGAPPIADGGDGGAQPPRFGAPSPAPGDDENNSPRRQREEAEGIAAHDQWTEKLKDGALSMASFAGKVYLAIEGLNFLNQGVLALNNDLAQYSGTLAASYARAENADILRDTRKAQALANPLSHLQQEESKLQDTLSDLITPIQGTLIEILARVTQLTNLGIEVVKDLTHLGILSDIYSWLVKQDESAPGGREFLQDLSDGKFDGLGIDDLGNRFELLDKKTRDQLGLTPATKRPARGKTP